MLWPILYFLAAIIVSPIHAETTTSTRTYIGRSGVARLTETFDPTWTVTYSYPEHNPTAFASCLLPSAESNINVLAKRGPSVVLRNGSHIANATCTPCCVSRPIQSAVYTWEAITPVPVTVGSVVVVIDSEMNRTSTTTIIKETTSLEVDGFPYNAGSWYRNGTFYEPTLTAPNTQILSGWDRNVTGTYPAPVRQIEKSHSWYGILPITTDGTVRCVTNYGSWMALPEPSITDFLDPGTANPSDPFGVWYILTYADGGRLSASKYFPGDLVESVQASCTYPNEVAPVRPVQFASFLLETTTTSGSVAASSTLAEPSAASVSTVAAQTEVGETSVTPPAFTAPSVGASKTTADGKASPSLPEPPPSQQLAEPSASVESIVSSPVSTASTTSREVGDWVADGLGMTRSSSSIDITTVAVPNETAILTAHQTHSLTISAETTGTISSIPAIAVQSATAILPSSSSSGISVVVIVSSSTAVLSANQFDPTKAGETIPTAADDSSAPAIAVSGASAILASSSSGTSTELSATEQTQPAVNTASTPMSEIPAIEGMTAGNDAVASYIESIFRVVNPSTSADGIEFQATPTRTDSAIVGTQTTGGSVPPQGTLSPNSQQVSASGPQSSAPASDLLTSESQTASPASETAGLSSPSTSRAETSATENAAGTSAPTYTGAGSRSWSVCSGVVWWIILMFSFCVYS